MKTTCLALALVATPLLAEPEKWQPLLPTEIIIPAASGEAAGEGGESDPEAERLRAARLVVHRDIIARLQTPRPIFSRVGPTVPSSSYEPVQFVDNERRLPFTVHTRNGRKFEEIKGYVRLADQAIFLLDEKTGKHHPASDDPRFAPARPVDESKAESPLC